MRRALALVALLGVVATASADLDIFFTPASWGFGLTDPSYDFKPTEGSQRDFDFYALKDGNTPPVPSHMPDAFDETCYLWVRFDGDPGRKIQGMHLNVKLDNLTIADSAYYIMDDQKTWFNKRWDGKYTAGAPEFKMNPQILVAMSAHGIFNKLGGDLLWNAETHTALVGAFKFSGVGTAVCEAGSLGIIYKQWPPRVRFHGITYNIPEPANALVLVLAGLLVRRR